MIVLRIKVHLGGTQSLESILKQVDRNVKKDTSPEWGALVYGDGG